jgi:hypothetical protein
MDRWLARADGLTPSTALASPKRLTGRRSDCFTEPRARCRGLIQMRVGSMASRTCLSSPLIQRRPTDTLIYHDTTCCCGPSLAKRGLLSGRLDVNSDSIFVTYLEGRLRGVTNRLLDAVPLRCFGCRYRAERLHLCYKVDVALPLQDGDA